MSTPSLFLVAPVRTPIGKFGGALQSLSAADLGTAAAKACLERSAMDPALVDQVVFGHGRQAGGGPNTARQVLYRAGVPVERPAMTLNQACGSGLQAIFTAARAILLGEASVVLAGGTESMSNTPYMLPRARWGYRMGQAEIVDGMYQDGFNDPLSKLVMGETAEELAVEAGIDRAAADAWGLRSQQRCEAARKAGRFAAEIAPITVPGKKGDTVLGSDEHPRDGMTIEAMHKLPAVFRKNGTVTAGNASGITDGAAAILVASEQAVREHGLQPIARLVGWSVVGCEPRIMGIGPVPACAELEKKTGVRTGDVDRMELNEAFASQVLACLQGLEIDPEKVNPDGGAIAIGHPIGCTGTRIMVTMLHGLASTSGKRGIATLCVSGGMGLAALVEMV